MVNAWSEQACWKALCTSNDCFAGLLSNFYINWKSFLSQLADVLYVIFSVHTTPEKVETGDIPLNISIFDKQRPLLLFYFDSFCFQGWDTKLINRALYSLDRDPRLREVCARNSCEAKSQTDSFIHLMNNYAQPANAAQLTHGQNKQCWKATCTETIIIASQAYFQSFTYNWKPFQSYLVDVLYECRSQSTLPPQH